MASNQITVKLTVAWWLRYYVYGLCVMHWITGAEVNEERVSKWMRRAMRVRINHA